MTELVLTLPAERPMSWNAFYSGKHWTVRSREKDRVTQVVRAALPADVVNAIGWPATRPVRIELTAYVKGRAMDADNVCSKLYIDALKGWVINDDDPAHVSEVVHRVIVDKRDPRVEIRVQDDGR